MKKFLVMRECGKGVFWEENFDCWGSDWREIREKNEPK